MPTYIKGLSIYIQEISLYIEDIPTYTEDTVPLYLCLNSKKIRIKEKGL